MVSKQAPPKKEILNMAKRSSWKGPFVDVSLLLDKRDVINTFSRNSVILPSFVNKIIRVHNGKSFVSLKIVEDMIGFKLGEFVSTRVRHIYKKKK